MIVNQRDRSKDHLALRRLHLGRAGSPQRAASLVGREAKELSGRQ